MTIRERFAAFFSAANDGRAPYPWQVTLAEQVAETGTWPTGICAPTGAGKSSVVDVHVFAVTERARQRRSGAPITVERAPRRLVLVAPRRVLVDDQYERALALAAAIRDAAPGSLLGETREVLASLVTAADLEHDPLGVSRLRGGIRAERGWRLDPGQCQVVCATPQMWGSRLLFRGYRSTRRARNLETGLLGHDAVAVIDEAHLHRRLVQTASRLAAMNPHHGSLQVVPMTATPAGPGGLGLTDDDHAAPALAQRVTATKSVSRHQVSDWRTDPESQLTELAVRARRDLDEPETVGVFVNTVERALRVADALGRADDGEVRVVCGRMRPADVQHLREQRPHLLGESGNRDVAYLVSTQSLEVGVDLDLAALVSEVASASALAQRAGRLNRTGRLTTAHLHIVEPAEPPADGEQAFLPYTARAIRHALEWLDALGGDASPATVNSTALPAPEAMPAPAITPVEVETLTMTTPALAAEPDADFYIDQPGEPPRREIQIAVRRHLELPDETVRLALTTAAPRAHELVTFPLDTLDRARVLTACDDAWLLRSVAGQVKAMRLKPAPPVDGPKPSPGDVLVINDGTRIAIRDVIAGDRASAAPIHDVMSSRPDSDQPDRVISVSDDHADALDEVARDTPEIRTRDDRAAVAEVLADLGEPDDAQRLRTRRLADLRVVWAHAPGATKPGLLVIVDQQRGGQDVDETTPEAPVTLAAHGDAVAQRMRSLIAVLDGLVDEHADTLALAARLHDEGKRHPEFQRRMGADPAGEPLAKPRPGHTPDRGDGWRHEQYSAAIAHAEGTDPLAVTVIAAHHGVGRPLFDRDHQRVIGTWTACPEPHVGALAELFGPAGTYEQQRHEQQREIGAHRLAYLEALLRCADIQVSREAS